jgi:hypothetical protein
MLVRKWDVRLLLESFDDRDEFVCRINGIKKIEFDGISQMAYIIE